MLGTGSRRDTVSGGLPEAEPWRPRTSHPATRPDGQESPPKRTSALLVGGGLQGEEAGIPASLRQKLLVAALFHDATGGVVVATSGVVYV